MPIDANYVLSASMDVTPEAEATFNEVYDAEHVPNLGAVPGVLSIVRFERTELRMGIGGEVLSVDPGDAPRYTALYELASPDVAVSPVAKQSQRGAGEGGGLFAPRLPVGLCE